MKFYRTGAFNYAVLLIILFAIAAVAVRQTLSFIESQQIPGDTTQILSSVIWTLTMGFMLIAGAFGLWAIKFSGEAESRRRISRFVDAMDYLQDGLFAVDKKGRITGSNPAAANIPGVRLGQETIGGLFPFLTGDDLTTLLTNREPLEIERDVATRAGPRTLRFRSQPTDDLTLILVSDVTSANAQRAHSRQMARLQLIGQLARGVANDFNNILSGISGHASLLTRLRPGSPEMAISIRSITQQSDQGAALAEHLMELASPVLNSRQTTDAIGEHVHTAAAMLRDSLPTGWRVESTVEGAIPTIGLTGLQFEQMVLNLGLLAADSAGVPGILRLLIGCPGSKPILNVGGNFGCVLLVAASTDEAPGIKSEAVVMDKTAETGVIQSVIRSMVDEAGGLFDSLADLNGAQIYRVALPIGHQPSPATPLPVGPALDAATLSQITRWTILFARPDREYEAIDRHLEKMGIHPVIVDNVMSALARVEGDRHIDAMILDKYILGQEAKGLIRAISKLQPRSGIVILCDDPETEALGMDASMSFVQTRADPERILFSLVQARQLALTKTPAPDAAILVKGT